MRRTTMTLQRAKQTLRTKIFVEIQNMTVQAAQDLGGQIPYDSFWIYVFDGSIDVRRGDLLIDESQIDTATGQATRYRVFGNLNPWPGSHTEIPSEKLIGV